MKTGSFNDVKCLVAAAEIDGKTYIAVLMQDGDPGRYQDAKTLFDYVAGDSGMAERICRRKNNEIKSM